MSTINLWKKGFYIRSSFKNIREYSYVPYEQINSIKFIQDPQETGASDYDRIKITTYNKESFDIDSDFEILIHNERWNLTPEESMIELFDKLTLEYLPEHYNKD